MKGKRILAIFLVAMMVFTQPVADGCIAKAEETNANKETYGETTECVSENAVTDNDRSDGSISDNSVSENSVSQNDAEANPTVGEDSKYGADTLPIDSPSVNSENTENTGTEIPQPDVPNTDQTETEEKAPEEKPINLEGISIEKLEMATYKSVKVTWAKVEDATGYEIYRSTKKGSRYQLVKTVGQNTFSITDKTKNLTPGKKYYYKVRPVRNEAGETLYGSYSAPKMIVYSLPAVDFRSVKPGAGGTLQLKWKKVKKADGYEIRRSSSENGRYKKFKTVESGTAQKYTLTATECNGSYFYKIRAYRIVDGKKVYGEYSQPKKAEMSNLAYDGETYQQKCMRVFGVATYKRYATEAEALKNMTTITVNVWDFDANGDKVTKQKKIVIHKNLAATVEQIFKEIYQGKEKFPIKAVGGFSWRGNGSTSEHNQGTAIDINPNENYMIEGDGTISSGSYWKPGEDPYSIPADGEVVKIFKKYGFGWGGNGWSSGRKDYMHFSYFGT